jgi:hypothetical protein
MGQPAEKSATPATADGGQERTGAGSEENNVWFPGAGIDQISGTATTGGTSGKSTKTPNATLTITDRGKILINDDIYDNAHTNGITMKATVSGVSRKNLRVTQNIDKIAYTMSNGKTITTRKNVPDTGITGKHWFDGTKWNAGYGYAKNNTRLDPKIKTEEDGTLSIIFYDNPGQPFKPDMMADVPFSRRGDYTTLIIDASTNTILASQKWHTIISFEKGGDSRTSFGIP